MDEERAGRPCVDPSPEALRDEIRAELQLLFQRVGALLAAEAFLVIAYTGTMAAQGRWHAVVAPVLSLLGLLLAVLGRLGAAPTARLVIRRTQEVQRIVEQHPDRAPAWLRDASAARRLVPEQRASLLFFQLAPVLFVLVWAVLGVVSLVLPGG